MADKRSKVTEVAMKDAERLYTSMNRKLARFRAMLDECKGKETMRLQYWNSGTEAERRFETFVRGVEDSDQA